MAVGPDAVTGGGGDAAPRAAAPSRAQLQVLSALAAAVWPSQAPPEGADEDLRRYYALSGADVPGVPEEAFAVINERLMGVNRTMLLLVLHALAWPLTTLLLAGRHCLSPEWPHLPRALPDMATADVQALLLAWRHAWLRPLRGAFKAIKSVLVAVIFAVVDAQGDNPFFAAPGYAAGRPRPWEPAASPAAVAAEEVLASAIVDARAALAAAGAGGFARYLARRGFAVVEGSGGGGDTAPADSETAPLLGSHSNSSSSGSAPIAVIEADAVIVGSGAGGGVAAARLAAAGLRVVVAEKGGWKRMGDLTLLEGESTREMFERGAFVTTEDGGMSVLAGATLGGGTKINWCASLRTPDHVCREWADEHGLPAFATAEYDAALDAVLARLGVSTTTRLNGNNGALYDGLVALGADARKLPRNCASDKCSGHCSLGCKTGHKASTDASYLADAARRGARVLTRARARRVLTERNPDGGAYGDSGGGVNQGQQQQEQQHYARRLRAVGVELAVGGDEDDFCGGGGATVIVRAPLVFAAAGAIHTPALLLRSGVAGGGNVGAHLRLHPAFGVMGKFDKRNQHCEGERGSIAMFDGVMMLTYSLSAAKWAEGGYGAMVSVPSLHPGLLAACHPWDPAAFKSKMLGMQDIATSVVFARDRGSGRITVDRRGRPRIHYWPCPDTRRAVLEGMELALRAYAAAGAESVLLPHAFGHLHATRAGGAEELDAMVAEAHRGGITLYDMPLLSAHQMGSCRMGGSPHASAADENGELWDAAGLFVADASAFPTASGVNPMVTAMAIAEMVSARAAARATAAATAARKAAAAAAAKAAAAAAAAAPSSPVASAFSAAAGAAPAPSAASAMAADAAAGLTSSSLGSHGHISDDDEDDDTDFVRDAGPAAANGAPAKF